MFNKAERKKAKLRLALCAPSGAGKTYSALLIAQGLGGRIAMIDTERGSGELYSHLCDYDVCQVTAPYTPEKYVTAIKEAERAGYSTIIIDSLTHAWAGTGGLLEEVDKRKGKGNDFTAWRDITPMHNALVTAMRKGEPQRKAYAGLHSLLENSVFSHSEDADARHEGKVLGQKTYYAAMRLPNGILFAVKFKLDIPQNRTHVAYKDHKVTEIEIAPVLSPAIPSEDGVRQKTSSAIYNVSLGVLRGAVKPSTLENGTLSSLHPGQFLPPAPKRTTHRPLLRSGVEKLARDLNSRAAKAAPTKVVQSFSELPEHIREQYSNEAQGLEGVYDPQSKAMWLVADNISTPERAAEVWVHEQVVHHGLRGMLPPKEMNRLLQHFWLDLGGLGNSAIKSLAERYGLRPLTNHEERIQLMEEYLAKLAEAKKDDMLSAREQSLWQKILSRIRFILDSVIHAVTGRATDVKNLDVDGLVAALGKYVIDGVPAGQSLDLGNAAMASLNEKGKSAENKAWEQLQRDSEDWERQLDDLNSGKLNPRTILTVGTTPDVLQKLGAPALNMTMTRDVLNKIGEGGKHGLPESVIRQLPELLAAPVMVFKSATQANSLVALLDTVHAGMPVVAAVHMEVQRGQVCINEIASVYGKSNGGLGWVDAEIQAGRRAYADKSKIPTWLRGFSENPESRRMSGLQLPRAFVLPNDPRGVKILSDKDIVKPVSPENKTLASLSFSSILGLTPSDSAKLVDEPEIRHYFKDNDLTFFQRVTRLPQWVAKDYPKFAKVYDRQIRRMDERASALQKSLEQVPSLFGKDSLGKSDMADLKKILWANEGKEIPELQDVEKFQATDKLANGRDLLEVRPEFYEAYSAWLERQPGSAKAKKAMLEIRKSLDNDLLTAYNRMAAMNELANDQISQLRTNIGFAPNYFPHHRYGNYFVQAKVGDEVVFRQHFDALPSYASIIAQKKAKELIQEQIKLHPEKYRGAVWSDGKNRQLSEDVYGAPIDTEAMEQIIKAAADKIERGFKFKVQHRLFGCWRLRKKPHRVS